jgi:hypothetical protein
MERDIIKNSKTKSQAVRSIYGYDNGTSRRKFEKLIKENEIDISHLTKQPFIYERKIKDCPVCGNKFETMVNHKREKTTCSHSCSNTYFRSGENNPNYGNLSGEKNHYRRICFEHHTKECVVCGENKIVSVHHYDENHNNNSIENLVPLCPTHHQYVHSKYKDEVIGKIDEYRDKLINKKWQQTENAK